MVGFFASPKEGESRGKREAEMEGGKEGERAHGPLTLGLVSPSVQRPCGRYGRSSAGI
jgi:hypothetical protein